MAYVIINEKHLEAIADALRARGGKPTYKPREMAPAIDALAGDGYNGLIGKYFIGVDVPGSAFEVIIKECLNDDGTLFLPENMWAGKTIKGDVVIPYGIIEIPDDYFKDTLGITDVEFPAGLTIIGAHAFDNAINGPNDTITLGPDVEQIGDYAFANNTFKVFRANSDNLTIGVGAFENSNIEEMEFDNNSTVLQGISNNSTLTKLTVNGDVAIYGISGNDALKEIIINGNITELGNYAFSSNEALPGIDAVLPQVPDGLFYGCSSLTDVTLSDDIETIGNNAFEGCSSLETISIPDKVTTIGDNAFEGCSSLENLELPNNLLSIGDNAFGYCYSLENLEIPEGLKTIGDYAFEESAIKTLELPEGCETLGDYTFQRSNLEKINLPSTIKNLNGFIFNECYELNEVTLNEGWEEIPAYTFENIDMNTGNVITFSCPSTLKTINNCAFKDSTYVWVKLNEGLETIGEYAFEGTLGAYMKTSGYPDYDSMLPSTLTSIGKGAFQNSDTGRIIIPPLITELKADTFKNAKVYKITLNEGLETIGNSCFEGNEINKITCPSTLKSIGDNAFANNGDYLSSLKLNEGLETIGANAFSYHPNLTNATLPSTLTKIGREAFRGCGITSVNIPSSVTSIGTRAFADNDLTEIILPEGLKSTGSIAFENNPNLTKLTLNEGLETIENYAFNQCSNLTNLTLPSTVKSIGTRAFYYTKVNYVDFPSTLETIGTEAFCNCQLTNGDSEVFTIPGTVKSIGARAFNYNKLRFVSLSEGVETIGSHAFDNNEISELSLPSTLKTVGEYAFYNNDISELTIPASVETIGNGAFGSNPLRTVNFSEGLKTIGKSAFYNCAYVTKYSLPKSLISVDNEAFGYDWSNYVTEIEFNLSPDHQLTLGSIYIKPQSITATDEKKYIIFKGQDGMKPKAYNNNYSIFSNSSVNNTSTTISVPWSQSENPAGFPWGATKATIIYNNGL